MAENIPYLGPPKIVDITVDQVDRSALYDIVDAATKNWSPELAVIDRVTMSIEIGEEVISLLGGKALSAEQSEVTGMAVGIDNVGSGQLVVEPREHTVLPLGRDNTQQFEPKREL